ncbi:SHOCT domain-containing protein [Microbispora sp. ATCC PTA-5024]|uniref:SHOCT domain-containing protein n=1 Tax=Microbispora sp. ATCC PTA-5024 TaxID=316330 RepID=UPI0004075D40|nr:SHOCT domain-containing protein [Microbispora sp. ATCC PTA-5024]
MMYWNGMNGWGYALMMTGNVIFWGAMIAGTVLLVRHLARTPHAPVGPGLPYAQEVLAQRYARGEIDTDEYQTRLDVLRRSQPEG